MTKHVQRLVWLVLPTLWACSETPSEVAWPSEVARPGGTEPVVTMLARLADESDPWIMVSESAARARILEARLGSLADPIMRRDLALRLGKEQLQAGETQAAIANFESLRDAADGEPTAAWWRRDIGAQLAIAYLRLAEQENCVAHHGASSCVFPLDAHARHGAVEGASKALHELKSLVAFDPRPDWVWLLNLAAMALGEDLSGVPPAWRLPAEVLASTGPMARFVDRAPAAGVATTGLSGGASMDDFDGDGLLDVVASSWGLRDPLRLFVNRGDGTFEQRIEAAGLLGEHGGLNVIHADDDNDGDLDLLVLRGAWQAKSGAFPNSLLRNRGNGIFDNRTREAGVLDFAPTQTAAWADFDGDGWLDLFVGFESFGGVATPCRLYRNNGPDASGEVTYTDVAPLVGLDLTGFVKGVTWGDYDNDGLPDLYVSRFGQPNLLFHNEGPSARHGGWPWHFVEVAAEAGTQEPIESFPTWFWDYDNDGWLDLLVAGYSGFEGQSLARVVEDMVGAGPRGSARQSLPRLYRNRGDGTFEDQTLAGGLDAVILAMGANFGDLDNDGWLDAYFGTGEPDLATLVPNRMFRGDGQGGFQDVTVAGGFGHLQKGHGVAFGDVDNDGDQDIYTVLGGAYEGDVYPNALFVNPGSDHHWLTLLLEGTRANRSAIGARVAVVLKTPSGRRVVHRMVGTGGSFGASSIQLEVGLDDATEVGEVVVRWPHRDARPMTYRGLALDAAFRLREGESEPQRLDRPRLNFER